MLFKLKYGPWAIVAGAAVGLGEAYSLALAQRGINLLMVDNKAESLHDLAVKIEQTYGIQTRELPIDLAGKTAVNEIMHAIKNIECRLLIYNAAYSKIQFFTSMTEADLDSFIEINTRTAVKLVHAFAKRLKKNKLPGGILLMSSLAGLLGMQLVAPYAATKAFIWNLVEALHYELKVAKIDVMACIAGAIATPAYLETNPQYGTFKPQVMKPAKVAEKALNKLGRKVLYVPGVMNRISYCILTRLLPRRTASTIANRTMGNLYKHIIEQE